MLKAISAFNLLDAQDSETYSRVLGGTFEWFGASSFYFLNSLLLCFVAAGITCDSDALLEAGRKLHKDPSMKLQGLYTHCGQAYTEMTPKQRKDDQKQLVNKLLAVAKKYLTLFRVNHHYCVNDCLNCISSTEMETCNSVPNLGLVCQLWFLF